MTGFPDFSALKFDDAPAAAPPAEDGAVWTTPEGIDVKPIYTAADLEGVDFADGYPGLAPFVRGPYPTMYVTNPWTVRQ